MIAPFVALRRRARHRSQPYRLPPLTKKRPLRNYQLETKTPRIALPPTPELTSTPVLPPEPALSSTPVLPLTQVLPPSPVSQDKANVLPDMAFGGEVEVEEIMMDDELLGDDDGISFELSEEEDDGYTGLKPKIPFKERVDPFVGPDDKKFLKTEDYFASLLRSPSLTIESILEGTFDPHEINLITPHPGPIDVVNWQRRNARRYYENLEMRFKGHQDTLAFKMSCLYFGLPVEPLRMGVLPFDLPLDSDPLDTKKSALETDALGFLKKYEYEDKAAYGMSTLSLRGGGASAYMPTTDAAKKKRKKPAAWGEKAVEEIAPEGYEMDFTWNSAAAAQVGTKDEDKKIPLYGWQGVMNTSLNYSEFVYQVDRLISNWKYIDLPICVEIWLTSPVQFKERVTGPIYHGDTNARTNDPVWNVVRKYFQQGNTTKYACFVRRGDEDFSADEDRPSGYQPSSSDKYVVRIEDETRGEVAYMRVPDKLDAGYKPHQFSNEYMLAMQSLLLPEKPHAWVSFQHGLIGDSYQYLDPPGGLWDQVIHDKKSWRSMPTISFKLKPLDKQVVPVIVPGTFRPGKQPELNRRDFKLTNSTTDSHGLGQLYRAVESSMRSNSFKSECGGFEIWSSGTNFKHLTEQPAFIKFSGSTTNISSLKGWQDFLASHVQTDPFCLVVRPVYKTYRLGRPDSNEKVPFLINQYDVKNFKAFVHNRLHESYDPNDPAQVIVLSPATKQSYQPQLIIRRDTTEEEWRWIRRNIIEPELIVTVDDWDNDWRIPSNAQWGPQYVPQVNPASISRPRSAKPSTRSPYATTREKPASIFNQPSSAPADEDMTLPGVKWRKAAVDDLFKNSKNTIDEATRMRELRDRSFTNTNSIFTNPLKPVMPLHGPPLESIIKTGPGMPGVSIAMMTPTEMLQLQREVHSLRFQLLDRTRECPYADCDRYFTFGDAEGLDRHVREDHSVLRCFLCDKDEHLLPYYDTEQIKKHFVTEHVADILRAFGKPGTQEASPLLKPGKPLRREATPATSESSSDSETSESEEESEEEKPIQQQQAQPNKLFQVPKSANPWALTSSARDSKGLSASVPPTAAAQTPDWGAIINRTRAETVGARASAAAKTIAKTASGSASQKRTGLDASFDFFQGGAQSQRKRKRPASLNVAAYESSSSSGSEGYEYSERSAVTDPVENLASPVKKRRAGPPPPTPVAAARRGWVGRPTRSVI